MKKTWAVLKANYKIIFWSGLIFSIAFLFLVDQFLIDRKHRLITFKTSVTQSAVVSSTPTLVKTEAVMASNPQQPTLPETKIQLVTPLFTLAPTQTPLPNPTQLMAREKLVCQGKTCAAYLLNQAQNKATVQTEYHFYPPTPLPDSPLLSVAIEQMNYEDAIKVCGSNLNPRLGSKSCQQALNIAAADFTQNVFHAPQIKSDYYSMLIYSNGFLGVPEDQRVTGSKPSPELTKDEIPQHTKYIPPLWQTKNIFAITVPPTLPGLIKKPKLLPYLADQATAQQYLNLQLFSEIGEWGVKAHYNLCGPLAAFVVIQPESLEKFFTTIFHLPWGKEFVADKDRGLDNVEMENIFVANNWRIAHNPPFPSAKDACSPWADIDNGRIYRGFAELCQIRTWLKQGQYPIIDGNLFTSPEVSVLTAPLGDSGGYHNVAHWTVVLETIRSRDGFDYIRIYNPYQNREEIYLWNDFYMAWRNHDRYGLYLIAHQAEK